MKKMTEQEILLNFGFAKLGPAKEQKREIEEIEKCTGGKILPQGRRWGRKDLPKVAAPKYGF